jgi:hypothetical protein
MTLNCLTKLCYAAEKLSHLKTEPSEARGALFPEVDDFTAFDDRGAGVWIFRNRHLAFQLPLIDGWNADYSAWPRWPEVFENPVESSIYCGVPRFAYGTGEYTVKGLPARVSNSAGKLTATYENIRRVDGTETPETLPAICTVTWRVDGESLRCEWKLDFEQAPSGVSLFIPETVRPLNVGVTYDRPFHQDIIAVSGMAHWRSPWSEAKNAHQIHLAPAREMAFTITLALCRAP